MSSRWTCALLIIVTGHLHTQTLRTWTHQDDEENHEKPKKLNTSNASLSKPADTCPLPAGAKWCSRQGGQKEIKMACYDLPGGKKEARRTNTLHDSVCHRICKTGSFEADITSKLTKDIFPRLRGETFLDVGMNVGTYGLLAASYGMKVIGFEPMPHNIALLRASFCANPDIAKNIQLHEVALSNEEKTCFIVSADTNVGNGIIQCTQDGAPLGPTKFSKTRRLAAKSVNGTLAGLRNGYSDRATVPLKKLSNYLTGAGKISYAKFDIEGHECLALKGGIELLKPEHRPSLIQTEYREKMAGCQPEEYLKMFSDAGYTVHTGWFKASPGEDIKRNGLKNIFIFDPGNPQNITI